MMFPSYADVNRIFILDDIKAGIECSHFMVFMQGYKMDIGFRIHRSSQKMNGTRMVDYTFQRYGWSTGMLKWRCLEFRQKTAYLEDFFRYADKDKIDVFLYKDNHVITEKSYRWPNVPLPLIDFTR